MGNAEVERGHDHAVQLYDREDELRDVVVEFLAAGAAANEPLILIARAAHRDAFLVGLRRRGVPVDRLIRSGRLLALDAEATLAQLLDGAMPDPARFRAVIDDVFDRVGGPARAYGEMVDLLWQRGEVDAAVALEALWNEEATRRRFQLLCAYDLTARAASDATGLARVCRAHDAVHAPRSRTERLAREMVDFLAIAGHELRTPLAAARLHVDALLRRTSEPATADRLDKTRGQLDRMSGLIDALLDVPRLSSGALMLDLEEVDVAHVARRVVERHAAAASYAGSPLRLLCSEGIVGRWDALRIEQVLGHLIGNAIKYGAGEPVEVIAREAGGVAEIVVRDHGIGIAPVDHARIFERFERGDAPATVDGLGLGLWIARRLTQAHGGTIHVDSAPGAGASFAVRLPLAGPVA